MMMLVSGSACVFVTLRNVDNEQKKINYGYTEQSQSVGVSLVTIQLCSSASDASRFCGAI